MTVGRRSGPDRALADRTELVASDPRDQLATVLDAATLNVTATTRGDLIGAIDGHELAEGAQDGTLRLVDARTGATRTLSGRHDGAVNRLAFSADGRTLVSAGLDGVALVWDVARGTVRDTLSGHRGLITDIALAPDGRTAFTASLDGTSIAWDLAGDRRFGQPFIDPPLTEDPPALAVSPDGARLLVGERDGSLGVWDTARMRRAGSLGPRLPAPASSLAFSPDGLRIATVADALGTYARAVHLLDARTGMPVGRPLPGLTRHGSQDVTWSPDGRYVAAGDYGGDVLTWDARTGAPGPLHFGLKGNPVLSVAFSPDGRRLAATFDTQGTEVRDVATGRLVAWLGRADEVRWVTWSPDGRLLVTGHYDGQARLWSTADWRPAGALAGHQGYVLWAGFSPDGRTLATAEHRRDGAAVGRRHRAAGSGPRCTVDANQWTTRDASRPMAGTCSRRRTSGRGVAWPTTTAAWNQHACVVAGRSITRAEWAAAVPGEPYRRVCS